jgi:hypothetical protein
MYLSRLCQKVQRQDNLWRTRGGIARKFGGERDIPCALMYLSRVLKVCQKVQRQVIFFRA